MGRSINLREAPDRLFDFLHFNLDVWGSRSRSTRPALGAFAFFSGTRLPDRPEETPFVVLCVCRSESRSTFASFSAKNPTADVFAPSTAPNRPTLRAPPIRAKFARLDFGEFVRRKPPFFTPPVNANRSIFFRSAVWRKVARFDFAASVCYKSISAKSSV